MATLAMPASVKTRAGAEPAPSTQTTVFDSTGLATHDIALASESYRLALKSRLGKSIFFFRERHQVEFSLK